MSSISDLVCMWRGRRAPGEKDPGVLLDEKATMSALQPGTLLERVQKRRRRRRKRRKRRKRALPSSREVRRAAQGTALTDGRGAAQQLGEVEEKGAMPLTRCKEGVGSSGVNARRKTQRPDKGGRAEGRDRSGSRVDFSSKHGSGGQPRSPAGSPAPMGTRSCRWGGSTARGGPQCGCGRVTLRVRGFALLPLRLPEQVDP